MDWSQALKAAQGDRILLGTIVAAALDESPRLLAAIREAIAAGNRTAIRLSAHTLKGSVQYFGANRVFELANRLERMGQEGDLAAAPAVLSYLETESTRLTDMLARHQQSLEKPARPRVSNIPANRRRRSGKTS